jgi:SET domain-containing protein
VDRSPIHGLGLFTAEPIPRGTEDVALRDIAAGEEITVDYPLVESRIVERRREAGAVGMPARMGVNPVAPPAGR